MRDLGQDEIFRKRTLGFQKIRTCDDRNKVKGCLGNWYPAELEGSDCKNVEDIGKGEKCFLKLGDFSFDAVKFALSDKDNRVSREPKSYAHSYIRSVRFTGGILDGEILRFSPELNTMIGIRGSGKSAVIEVLRYALDIPFGEKPEDEKYKQKLVEFTLGSGGKVEIDAIDRHGQQYTIRRVWKEPYSEVLIGGQLKSGVSIRETVLRKPIYFGQKDLSSTGKGFEKNLVDKLFGSKLDEVRHKIDKQKQNITDAVDRLFKVATVQDQITEQIYEQYETYVAFLDKVKGWLSSRATVRKSLISSQSELSEIRKGMVEEFAEIERKLTENLKSSGSQNISSDEFFSLKSKLASATQMISELKKQDDQKRAYDDALLTELTTLNELCLDEFNLIKAELDKVGSDNSPISITLGYKEDKSAFFAFMKDIFKGSGIRDTTYQGIVDEYVDFAAIYKDLANAQSLFGSNPEILKDLFKKNLKALLTFQTPNKFTIMYREKELQHHSLGQRASALILFVLSPRENDVIIIDQPEDDLDNQTIYEDVIKLIRRMKPEVQFIFATHNPNIPVLGDAELVHACTFMDDKETVYSGSVDNSITQETIIKIMEGGKEAFKRRKEIYQIWKS